MPLHYSVEQRASGLVKVKLHCKRSLLPSSRLVLARLHYAVQLLLAIRSTASTRTGVVALRSRPPLTLQSSA
jgi:hypothetical protein